LLEQDLITIHPLEQFVTTAGNTYRPPTADSYAHGQVRHSDTPIAARPFDGESTTKHDYPAHAIQPNATPTRERAPVRHIPFEGESTLHHDYPAHQVQRDNQQYRMHDEIAPESRRFEGSSEYHNQYVPKEGERSRHESTTPGKSSRQVQQRHYDPDVLHSMNEATYVQPPEAAYHQWRAGRPEHSVEERHFDPNDMKSTSQNTYREPPRDAYASRGSPEKVGRPFVQRHASEGHFETVAHATYAAPGQDAYRHENYSPDRSLQASRPFEGHSSYADTFVPHRIEAPPPAGKSTQRQPTSSRPFEGESTAHSSFVKHPVTGMPGHIRQQDENPVISRPYGDVKSSYDADYVPRDIEIQQKQNIAAGRSYQQRHYDPDALRTTSAQTFTPHSIHVCPSTKLPPREPNPLTGHVEFRRQSVLDAIAK
jgi:hypothetical protein